MQYVVNNNGNTTSLKDIVILIDRKLDSLINKVEDPVNGLVSINQRLENLENNLGDPENGLESINSRLEAVRASVVTMESTIKVDRDMYYKNNDNIKKLDRRLDIVEEELAINPPEELSLTKVD